MNLSAPKQLTFWIAVVVAVIGVVANFVPAVAAYALWVVVVAFVILALGVLIEGL